MTQPEKEPIREPEPSAVEGWDAGEDEFDEDDDLDVGEPTHSDCRCGECCRHLIIEVGLEDAEREPQIKKRGSPIRMPADLTASRQDELVGYLLNSPDNGNACVFLDQTRNLCSIYDTRPWVCRVFDCDREGKEQLVQLGIRPGGGQSR
jgi:Fe-S-cluster containining protein